MASDTLGYMPLSKRRISRLDRQTKILMCLAFFSGLTVFWTIGYFRRLNRLGPATSALDNYQKMYASLSLYVSLSNFFSTATVVP
jgi:hypothetical protein